MTGTAAPAIPRSIAAVIVDNLVAFCGVVPYALVALGLRAVMARLFFLRARPGSKDRSFRSSAIIPGLDFAVILPAQIRDADLPDVRDPVSPTCRLSPSVAAYLFTYAEFVLPICLRAGLRHSPRGAGAAGHDGAAPALRAPAMWWTAHVYWVRSCWC